VQLGIALAGCVFVLFLKLLPGIEPVNTNTSLDINAKIIFRNLLDWHNEMQQTPEFLEAVLQRSACDQNPAVGFELH
jgi:hypothetical protein